MSLVPMTIGSVQAARKPLTKQRGWTRFDVDPNDVVSNGNRCEETWNPKASEGDRFRIAFCVFLRGGGIEGTSYIPEPNQNWSHPFQWHSPGGGHGGPPFALSAVSTKVWHTTIRGGNNA